MDLSGSVLPIAPGDMLAWGLAPGCTSGFLGFYTFVLDASLHTSFYVPYHETPVYLCAYCPSTGSLSWGPHGHVIARIRRAPPSAPVGG